MDHQLHERRRGQRLISLAVYVPWHVSMADAGLVSAKSARTADAVTLLRKAPSAKCTSCLPVRIVPAAPKRGMPVRQRQQARWPGRAQGQPIAETPEHHERDDVARVLSPVRHVALRSFNCLPDSRASGGCDRAGEEFGAALGVKRAVKLGILAADMDHAQSRPDYLGERLASGSAPRARACRPAVPI
jgi:hypothetical protein